MVVHEQLRTWDTSVSSCLAWFGALGIHGRAPTSCMSGFAGSTAGQLPHCVPKQQRPENSCHRRRRQQLLSCTLEFQDCCGEFILVSVCNSCLARHLVATVCQCFSEQSPSKYDSIAAAFAVGIFKFTGASTSCVLVQKGLQPSKSATA